MYGYNEHARLVYIDQSDVMLFHVLAIHSESMIEIYGDIYDDGK